MKLSTIVTIAAGVVGAVAAAICIHGKSDADVEVTETPTETTEEPTAETTAEA